MVSTVVLLHDPNHNLRAHGRRPSPGVFAPRPAMERSLREQDLALIESGGHVYLTRGEAFPLTENGHSALRIVDGISCPGGVRIKGN